MSRYRARNASGSPRWARSTNPPASSANAPADAPANTPEPSARWVSPAGTLLPAGDVPAAGSSVRTGIGLQPFQAIADSSQQREIRRLRPLGGSLRAPGRGGGAG